MHTAWGSHAINRHQGSLSPRANTPMSETLPLLRLRQMAFSIQGHAVWTVLGTEDVHKDSSGLGGFVEGVIHLHCLLPGRYSAFVGLSSPGTSGQTDCYSYPAEPWFRPQFRQEPSFSNDDHSTPGGDYRFFTRPCISLPGLPDQYQGHCTPDSINDLCATPLVVPNLGKVHFLHSHCAVGSPPLPSTAVVPASFSTDRSVRIINQSSGPPSCAGVSSLVGLSGASIRDSLPRASASYNYHGCQPIWLGRTPGLDSCARDLVPSGTTTQYQLVRTTGGETPPQYQEN
ncbi:uncharacterized protein LOC132709381 [Pantherophis guttatus]|uniref:Uncharacterized protein LOC132709381 n=1 Tax=Pantherophis guttatus TaxID=94885 RepID=A0ABM3YRS3_PANGU|nr:uncharacterized protein LOC132709381 [Pantherophis guttatus]